MESYRYSVMFRSLFQSPSSPCIDYSNQDITDEQIDGIVKALTRKTSQIYEINLLQTGITEEQIMRLRSAILFNTSLFVFKIQVFNDHSSEIKEVISEIKKHVSENKERGKACASNLSDPAKPFI